MKLFLLLTVMGVGMASADDVTADQLLSTGNNQFSAKFFNEVTKKNPGQSVVMSAFSVLTPLALLGLASDGASHDELLKAIGMPNDNKTKEAFSHLTKRVRDVKGIELKMANRVYIPEGHKLNANFGAVSRDVFGTEVKGVDFTKNVATAAEINTWVEDNTNKRIKDLVDPNSLTASTRAVLVNAIYFKGKWKSPFSKDATVDSDFHVTKEKTVKVPMMYNKDDYLYYESPELEAALLKIPYADDDSHMLIILPNAIDGLSALEEKLKDPKVLDDAVKKMRVFEVEVHLPKFKIETKTDLKEILSKIGVERMFDGSKAQINNLIEGENNLFISEAIQKAFIEVNEEGAEAAAANGFFAVATSAIINTRTAIFRADRPFLFYLGQGETTLFSGAFFE